MAGVISVIGETGERDESDLAFKNKGEGRV